MADKFDFKRYMKDNPERVALFSCGALMAILFVWGVVNIFRAPSSKKLAVTIDQQAKGKERELSNPNNLPSGADLPDPAKLSVRLESFRLAQIDLPARFAGAEAFASAYPSDDRRRQPGLLLPVEGRGTVVMTQLRSYIFSRENDRDMVAVLEGGGGAGNSSDLSRLQGLGGKGPGKGGRSNQYDFGNQGPGAGMPPGDPGKDIDSGAKQPLKKISVPVDDLDKYKDKYHLAEQALPLRMAILVASFPYKAQLEEFRVKLGKRTVAEVLAEPSLEQAPAEGDMGQPMPGKQQQFLPAFRFTGVNLERRVVDATGKPVFPQPPTESPDKAGEKLVPDKEGWVRLDPGKAYRPLVIKTGRRLEEENDKKLDAVMFDGLVMPRLLQMRGSQYPKIERELPKISDTLAKLSDKAADQKSGRPKNLTADDFDPFSIRRDDQKQGGGGGAGPMPMGGGGAPASGPIKPPDSGRPPDSGGAGGAEVDPVPYCLVRLIDVTVKPGLVYEYRMQVRLANPNYKHEKDVANPNYARDKELVSDEWFVLPEKVAVPPELHVYAIDQKVVDGRDEKTNQDLYKGINAWLLPDRNAIVLQVHRWLDTVPSGKGNVGVGEWSVAERLIVQRGEVVDRHARVEVPFWSDTRESWALLTGEGEKVKGYSVFFGNELRPTVLADFDDGEHTHPRLKARELARGEVLLLSPDGRLLMQDTVTDRSDKERQARHKDWRVRIEDVRKGGGGGKPNDPSRPPFGGK